MHILAVTPYYDPEGGGLERYANSILGSLADRLHEVEVLTLTRTGAASGPRRGVGVERIPSRWALGNSPVEPAFKSAVAAAIRRFSPDVVVAHTPVPFAAEMAFLAARKAETPFVLTYHAGRLSGSSPPLAAMAALHRSTMERWMIARSAGLIAVSPYVRDHALHRHRDRVRVVPPGVDVQRFDSDSPASGKGILFVAPLAKSYAWKGVDVLVRAFRILLRQVPAVTLTLVGDGDRRAEFEALSREFHGALRVVGRLPEAQLIEQYRRAAVVVLPSTSEAESFGMVLAEANACRRPVVASRIGGIPDFVRDGENGLLAKPGDAADLASKIGWLLEDEDLARRLGETGRTRVARDHDWRSLAIQTHAILEDAVRFHGP
ncbi:MAG: glycosyltransferase family 4 protein [bacterium]